MTPRTSEQVRLRSTASGNDGASPPWRDVISLELALRGEDAKVQDGLWKLADEVDNTGVLIKRIAERWAKNWEVYDHRLSRAIEPYTSFDEVDTRVARARVLEQGLHDALQEAEERGVTKVIEDGAAESAWWLFDLRQQDLENAAAVVQVGLASEIIDEVGPPPLFLDGFEAAKRELEAIATGEDPQDPTVPATELRAFLYASWLRARATQRAEVNFLGTTYRYVDNGRQVEVIYAELQ